MPRPVCITYDSTCDLTPALLERFQIRTVPLTIQTGERIFPDDGHYTSEDLYADFHRDGTLPKTSAVSPEQFKEFFGAILAEGFDIVHIDISADLSGTCQNALIAAAELETVIACGVDYIQGYYIARPDFEVRPIPARVQQEILTLYRKYTFG